MKRWLFAIFFLLCLGAGNFALAGLFERVETTHELIEYFGEYDTAVSLVRYLLNQQQQTHCVHEWLQLSYTEDYAWICALHNVFDDTWYLYFEMGDRALVDRKTAVIMRDDEVIRHHSVSGSAAREVLSGVIPRIEQKPGEYVAYFSIERDGEIAHAVWQYIEMES